MGINSTVVSYSFGQMGTMFNDGTAVMSPPTGKVFVAITFLEDTTFNNSASGLAADNDISSGLEWANTGGAAHDAALSPDLGESGAGGETIPSTQTFPKGVTIYGRYTQIRIATGAVLAYLGN